MEINRDIWRRNDYGISEHNKITDTNIFTVPGLCLSGLCTDGNFPGTHRAKTDDNPPRVASFLAWGILLRVGAPILRHSSSAPMSAPKKAGCQRAEKNKAGPSLVRLFSIHAVFWTLSDFAGFGLKAQMAERVGFEPTCRLLTHNPISSRARYGHFGTSPRHERGNALIGETRLAGNSRFSQHAPFFRHVSARAGKPYKHPFSSAIKSS